MAFWLLVERLENWETDEREGFHRFGLPESKAALAAQIKTGDLLIFYVSSGISRFSDIREAVADGTRKLLHGGDYDTAFPIMLSTRPQLTLSRLSWVPIKPLIGGLSFTKGTSDWRQLMRTSLRHLNEADARLIINAMRKNA